MRVPASELPDSRKIATWAKENLPPHYDLIDVRCAYGSDMPTIPDDWEIIIEFVEREADLAAGIDGPRAHHAWSEPLIKKIRAEWPASTLRITFRGREMEA